MIRRLLSCLFLAVLMAATFPVVFAGSGEKLSINKDWEFIKSDADGPLEVDWKKNSAAVNFPHTWNNEDSMDESPGYFRGAAWYRKTIPLRTDREMERVYLEFEAANQETEIYINGKKAGSHIGGYTIFRFDITDFLEDDDTEFQLDIRVDNSHNPDIPPQSADFTFFGGIYRDAWLIYVPEVHFSLDHYGGAGIYWQTPSVNREEAELRIFGFVSNLSGKKSSCRIRHVIRDGNDNIVSQKDFKQNFKKGRNQASHAVSFYIPSPELWSPDSPQTYSLETSLENARSGEIIDQKSISLGFRWFEFSPERGFLLNGENMKIKGISRHQDYPGIGNALETEQNTMDIRLIKDLGGNFLRVAHYPQDQDILDACDGEGLLASVEIPVVNRITESEAFSNNCIHMMKEMIWQNYNHPGLIMWTYMNEVLLRLPYENEDSLSTYYKNVAALAEELEKTARRLDPYRVTMIPNHGSMSRYNEAGLTRIPMVVGWNLYNGWYGSGFDGFGRFLDNHHTLLPDKPLLVTEYGAGHDPRMISSDPKRFDFTAEYSMLYHQKYVSEMEKRDFVAGGIIWILNDFCSEGRGDAVPNVNNKGICTIDRKPKESYWFYKSIWNPDPFVKIWTPFEGIKVSGGNDLKIYTSLDRLSIQVNGEKSGWFTSEGGIINAKLALKAGENFIRAEDPVSGVFDTLSLQFFNGQEQLPELASGLHLNISCGDHRYLWDPEEQILWLPDREYQEGSWGHLGGEPYTERTRHGRKPSSDHDILGTSLDPVFQTQQVDPSEYRFDLPAGSYELTLLFSELSPDKESEISVYNLGDDSIPEELTEREFSISLNGTEIIKSLDISGSAGSYNAVEKKFDVDISEGEGLKLKFLDKKGEPVISGIVLRGLE